MTRRVTAFIISALALAATVSACGISTEDQPRPFNPETSTTVANESSHPGSLIP